MFLVVCKTEGDLYCRSKSDEVKTSGRMLKVITISMQTDAKKHSELKGTTAHAAGSPSVLDLVHSSGGWVKTLSGYVVYAMC